MSYFLKPALLAGVMGLSSSAAFAHAGHLGELAGHSHWIGIAAVTGAAIIAGLAAKAKKRSSSSEENSPENAESDGALSPDGTEAEPA
ncbi:DUF6732 family protein [Pseudovibrio ascidiaceicola]|jgi:hypothetical protein|uniref:Uncharacterized protein n=1 Tax=Pseudovibrio ascidiaceicola TaxID=285279 RepID=A0A1I3W212_9HYPH|nr:DUF6732 family protein [Pseudovibrio ascidiaceicola]SFK01674.1 hypothetical protein SAMN04488518_101780 [Pseudovibrio ascidiaceicola]